MKSIRTKILEQMKNTIMNSGVNAVLQRAGNDGYPVDCLNVLYEDEEFGFYESVGEYFFSEQDEETGVSIFVSKITLTSDFPQKNIIDLMAALGRLNEALPIGSWYLSDGTDSICFSVNVPIEADMSEDELLDQVNISMGMAYYIAERFGGLLYQLATAKISLEDFCDFF